MKNGLKEEVQCVFFCDDQKNVFHSSVLTPSIDYPEFGHKKIGVAKKIGQKLLLRKKVGSQKNELLRVSGEKISAAKKIGSKKNRC